MMRQGRRPPLRAKTAAHLSERQAASLACLGNLFAQAKRGLPPRRAKATPKRRKLRQMLHLLPELSSDLGLLVPSSKDLPRRRVMLPAEPYRALNCRCLA